MFTKLSLLVCFTCLLVSAACADEDVSVRSLNSCLTACRGGTATIKAFCRIPTLPPQVRPVCWALDLTKFWTTAAVTACRGFCWRFFD